MCRRGTCHDNAVAESFFNLLKRERIRRQIYKSRAEARQDVFDYIEMFYNPKRKHVRNGMLSPVEFERQQKTDRRGCLENLGLFRILTNATSKRLKKFRDIATRYGHTVSAN